MKSNSEITTDTESTPKKRIEAPALFLWAAYALSLLLIILVVIDNLQP